MNLMFLQKNSAYCIDSGYDSFGIVCQHIFKCKTNFHTLIVENLDAVNKGFPPKSELPIV
jgi:hypothetical protein